jgi:hypothetical protein
MKKRDIIISLSLVIWHVTLPQNNNAIFFETPQKNIEIENIGVLPYHSLQFFIRSSANAQFQSVSPIVNELLARRKITITVDLTDITVPPDSKSTLYLFAGNELLFYQDVVVTNNLPTSFGLLQNFPNPFNSSTIISYSIPQSLNNVKTTLAIYDISGKLVKTLFSDIVQSGNYSLSWDGTNSTQQMVASGSYYYRLTASTFQETRKFVLIK